MTKARLPIDALLLISLSGGCTAASTKTVASPAAPSPHHRMNVISSADMATFPNLYEAVSILRPNWLSARGANPGQLPAVYLDGVLTPGVSILSSIDPQLVLEVSYLSALEATTRFGPFNGKGAILITTKR